MSVFEQLGGEPAIAAAVDAFYDRMLDDPLIAPWFDGMDMANLKAHQRAYLAVALGGPEEYDGRSMRNAHAGLRITDEAYSRTIQHLSEALAEIGAEPALVRTVARRMELMRAAIVEVR